MPMVLEQWLDAHPVDPKFHRELKPWFDSQVDAMHEQQPELCQWIRGNKEATQLRLCGEAPPDLTATRRRPTQMGIIVPSRNHLAREAPEKAPRLPQMDRDTHGRHVAQLTMQKDQVAHLVAEIRRLDSQRMREITAEISIFADLDDNDELSVDEIRDFQRLCALSKDLAKALHDAVAIANRLTAHVRFQKQIRAVANTEHYTDPQTGKVFMSELMLDFVRYMEIVAIEHLRASDRQGTLRQWNRLLHINVRKRIADF